jgi:chaperone LolA
MMNKFPYRKVFLPAAFFFFFLQSSAQNKYSAETVIDKVQKKYTHMNDAEASFTQKMKLRFGKTEQVLDGFVKIKKGNKYKITTPQQQIITDGKTVWIYTQSNDQVLIDRFKESRSTFSPDKFLKGFPADFVPSNVEEKEGYVIVTLHPSSKKAQNFITTLTMWIKPVEWIVSMIEYQDRNLTSYSISLTNIQFNYGISDNEFQFVPGKETHVVDLRSLK